MNGVLGGEHRRPLPNGGRRRGAGGVVGQSGDDTSMGEPVLLAQLIGDCQFRLDPPLTHIEETDTEKVHEGSPDEYGLDPLAEVRHRQDATHTRSSRIAPIASRG